MKNKIKIIPAIIVLFISILGSGCQNKNHSEDDISPTDSDKYMEPDHTKVDSVNKIDTSYLRDGLIHNPDSLHHTF